MSDELGPDSTYTFLADLKEYIPETPEGTIISRTVFGNELVRNTLFGFAPGEELTEHTATRPAMLHFLAGRAQLVLGSDELQAVPGTWVFMPANLTHSIKAETATLMLLTLFK